MKMVKTNALINRVSNNIYTNQKNSRLAFKLPKKGNLIDCLDEKLLKRAEGCNPILKYYLFGLAIPLPFTSTIGAILGVGIYLTQIFKKYGKKLFLE